MFFKLSDVSPIRLIVSSFAIIILIGTLLLSLPISSRNYQEINLIDRFFVATSATCVTGLTPFDTWTTWTGFGQVVILMLIQLGGIGLITFTTGFTLLFRRKLGLRDMQVIKEYTSGNVTELYKLVKTILLVTICCEALGSALISIRLIPRYGVYGIWASIFTAVSAYCNAGFDVFGIDSPGMSLSEFVMDPLISITVALLIILGGIGFVVIVDVHSYISNRMKNKNVRPHINLHSAIVIKMTIALLIIGTALIFLLEYDNTLSQLNVWGKLNASFFTSASARTAGFFISDVPAQHDITKIVTIILMFIGASPSSTGGGIKTTTLVVLISTVISVLKGEPDTVIRRRRVDKTVVYKALSICFLGLVLIFITTGIIYAAEVTQNLSGVDIIYEAVSAFATVGVTAGITSKLSILSKLAISITMFIGRVGPISLILSLTLRHNNRIEKVLPDAKIIVG